MGYDVVMLFDSNPKMYCWNQTAGSEYPCPTLRPVVRPCNLFTITQVNLAALLRYCITLEKNVAREQVARLSHDISASTIRSTTNTV